MNKKKYLNIGLLSMAMLFTGCMNPVVKNEQNQANNHNESAEKSQNFQNMLHKYQSEASKQTDKSDFSNMFNTNYANVTFTGKYTKDQLSGINTNSGDNNSNNNNDPFMVIKHVKGDSENNNNVFYYYRIKKTLTNDNKITLLDNLEDMYKAFTNKTSADSKMNNYGSYINKADLIARNPYFNYSQQKAKWTTLLDNLGVAKENLLYDDASGNLSDNSNDPLNNSFDIFDLITSYQSSNTVTSALNFENSLCNTINSQIDYINLLYTNANQNDLKTSKNNVIKAQIKLAHEYEIAISVLKPQVNSVKQHKDEDMMNETKAKQWEKQAEKDEDNDN